MSELLTVSVWALFRVPTTSTRSLLVLGGLARLAVPLFLQFDWGDASQAFERIFRSL